MIIGFDGRYAEGDLGGIGKYIQNLTLGLTKKGISCVIFYSKNPKVRITGTKAVVLRSRNRYFFEQILIPIALSKYKVDLYHATANLGVPAISPVPVVLTVHDTIPLDFKNYFVDSKFPVISKISYLLRFKISMERANKIVAITNFTKNNLVKNYHVKSKKIRVINSGINTGLGEAKSVHNLVQGQYFINNGGIDIRKNQERLIRAYKLVRIRFPGIKLVITGDNRSIKPKLINLVRTLGLTQCVIFVGYVDETTLWNLMRNSVGVIYPSLTEGFGSPVLEGFAAGVPVISSNTTSIPEISEDGALLINPLDVGEIARAMAKVLSDRTYRESLITKGKRIVWKYNWGKAIDEYIDLYNNTK